MAVALGFITIVVRRDAIETKVSGGWKAWYDKHSHLMGRACWHDEELFVISWMNHTDSSRTLNEFKDMGLISMKQTPDGTSLWEDMCVLEMNSYPNCDWLEAVGDELLGPTAVKLMGSLDDRVVKPEWYDS